MCSLHVVMLYDKIVSCFTHLQGHWATSIVTRIDKGHIVWRSYDKTEAIRMQCSPLEERAQAELVQCYLQRAAR